MKKALTLALFAVVAITATACGGCGCWPQKDCCEDSCGTCYEDSKTSSYPKNA